MVKFVKTYGSDGRPMYIAIDEPKWFQYHVRLNPTPKPPDLTTPIGRLNAKIATMNLTERMIANETTVTRVTAEK